MKDSRVPLGVGDVFVPGGQPTVTYNPRDTLRLEQRVRDYLSERRQILSIAGPTKSGKTVLLKKILRDEKRVWLEGGQVSSIGAFWSQVAEDLQVALKSSTTTSHTDTKGNVAAFGADIAPYGVGPKASGSRSSSKSDTDAKTYTMVRSEPRAAARALRDSGAVLVIDDFHYIDAATQRAIVRGLKDSVFEGLPMIVAAVPHRGEDPIRAEREMTGRVAQLRIPFWTDAELKAIATDGFGALHVRATDAIVDDLVRNAFQSPHLMQQFCRELAKANGITHEQAIRKDLQTIASSGDFYRANCAVTSRDAFDMLVKGPPTRGEKRISRAVRHGGGTQETDIYGAVLAGIAHTGPLTEISVDKLRDSLAEILDGAMPARNELSRVLGEMSKIALKFAKGDEPVVDYVASNSTLYISDPFFAYFLRWCMELPGGLA